MKALVLALLGAWYIYLAPVGFAADPDFYHRTGTKPPVAGDFVLGPSLHYSQQLSPGISFGYVWKQTGIALVSDFSELRLDAQNGSAPYQVGGCTRYADWTTGSHTTGQFSIGLLVPLRDFGKAAK